MLEISLPVHLMDHEYNICMVNYGYVTVVSSRPSAGATWLRHGNGQVGFDAHREFRMRLVDLWVRHEKAVGI